MNSRPIVALPDGGTGTIDNWEMTARFKETTPSERYFNRQISFEVDMRWLGRDFPSGKMGESFLADRMGFVSPSGVFVSPPHLRGVLREHDTRYEGLAAATLPDEAGTFYLIFTPHPYKHFLVWTVDLPYLPVTG